MTALFKDINPLAARQPKTDRLILPRFLEEESKDVRIKEDAERAHAILTRWADLETKGKLEKLKETQLQGDFLAEVFGDALGYRRATEGETTWTLEQHQTIGTQTPDAVLGKFGPGVTDPKVAAVIELKGAKTHLDLGRSNARTPVDQCWDYLVNLPTTCRWGIVSNFVSFRLYERNSTKRRYEHFTLQSLRNFDTFRQFYVLFHYNGLVEGVLRGPPRANALVQKTSERQRTVGDELYQTYSQKRTDLIQELHIEKGHPLPDAIEWAQRLFDRVIFIAFCEDRELLPKKTLETAWDVKGFHAVKNPRWQSYKNLFRMVDTGGPSDSHIPAYNGGLFAKSPVDDLELDDDRYTGFFRNLGGYDFADEVNLDVLGHLFERSITEVEKLKESGFFGGDAGKAQAFAQMPQSAKRKRLGIYYTPPELTSRIVEYTVEELIDERFKAIKGDPESAETARARLAVLRNLKIVDPACGSGAFLFQAYHALEFRYQEVLARLPKAERAEVAPKIPTFILNDNLYGVDLSPEAVEITQLALWIRSATRDQKLTRLSHNIVHGNSLVADKSVDPHAFDWHASFPEVFNRAEPGFDCVIGNPPWERIKLQEREFFSIAAPEIASATNAAKRQRLIDALPRINPQLDQNYQAAIASAERLSSYCRTSGDYPLTGGGDTNTFAVFAERAAWLVSRHGRVGFLVPSQIVFAKTYGEFFYQALTSGRLRYFYDFENRLPKKERYFPEVDSRFKFGILGLGGPRENYQKANFHFFLHSVAELDQKKRPLEIDADMIVALNPDSHTCPIFKTRRDASIVTQIYSRVPILRRKNKKTGNPWQITLKRKFDQDSKSAEFRDGAELAAINCVLKKNFWVAKDHQFIPLYEAKMVQAYDHRAASVYLEQANWNRLAQTKETRLTEHQDPEFSAIPIHWVDDRFAARELGAYSAEFYIAFKKVTSATNTRTMIASVIPRCAPIDSLPFAHFAKEISVKRRLCCLANWNSFAYDFVAQQKVGANHLQHYHVEQLPTFPPDRYNELCPWQKSNTLEAWIAERVLKLTCTAEDMLPLADACGFTGGSFKTEYGGRLHKWNERERAEMMAELDAAFFHLYGLDHDDAEYVLSTFKGVHEGNPLLPGHPSTAKFVMELFDAFAMQS